MRRTRGRVVEVDSLEELQARLGRGARTLSGWWVLGLDLREHGTDLARCDVAGATFLGCTFAEGDEQSLEERGALVFPGIPGAPVDAYRASLYTAEELYDTPAYAASLDARAYAWSRGAQPHDALLAQALHDHAIDQALLAWVRSRRLVGVMGGHEWRRDQPDYAGAARLGQLLGRTHAVATGGGPGAMEAANLGGRLAGCSEEVLGEAVRRLAAVPSYRPSVAAWADAAFEVTDGVPEPRDSLGIPTWHYGHEPPNVFATAIAKYFRNATREAILLQLCDSGIVFLPGAGGTVQEVFQDACENYYADESSVAPMVLVGREYWTEQVPAWQLLTALARGRAMEEHVHLVDTVDDAGHLIELATKERLGGLGSPGDPDPS